MRAKWNRRSALVFVAAVGGAAACGVHTSSSGGVKILTIAPDTGTIAGGPQVTLTGSGFDDHTGHVNVTIGNGTVVGDIIDDTTVKAPLPGSLACGKVDVQVVTTHGDGFRANFFTYTGGDAPLTIDSISPNAGDATGGTPVTITGSGFTGGVGLSIGGELLTNVVIVDDHTVTAITPPHTTGGAADLVARNCAHQAQKPGAFVFLVPQNGGVVEFRDEHYPDPQQFSNNPSDDLYIFAAYFQPTTEPMLAVIPSAGVCEILTSGTAAPLTELDGGPSITFASGGVSLPVAQETTASGTYVDYYHYDTDVGDYLAGQTYSFSNEGNATLPAFTTTGAFIAPSAISFNGATTTLLFTGNSTTNPSTVTKSNGMQLTWNGAAPEPPEFVVIQMNGYNASAQYQNSIICTAADNGSFKVPASALNQLSGAVQAVVIVDRRRVSTFVNGGNGTSMTALGNHRQFGVVLLQ